MSKEAKIETEEKQVEGESTQGEKVQDVAAATSSETAPEGNADDGQGTSDKFKQGMAGAKSNISSIKAHKEKRAELEQANAELVSMQSHHDELTADHGRRTDVETNFDAIVAEQTGVLNESNKNIAECVEYIQTLNDKLEPHEAELRAMNARFEADREPFERKVRQAQMEVDNANMQLSSTIDRLKAAQEMQKTFEKNLEQAQRNIKALRSQMLDLDQQAQRMRNSESGLDETTYMTAVNDLNSRIQTENMNESSARTQLGNQMNAVMQAQGDVNREEGNVRLAESKRDGEQSELNRVIEQQQAERAPLLAIIEPLRNELSEWIEAKSQNESVAEKAQSILDDANDIHAHPEIIEDLACQIAEMKKKLEDQQALIGRLEAEEADLANSAKKGKMVIGGVVAAIVVIIAIIVLIATML